MISHHHRTIFIHIPKCAGQSIETAFLSDVGLTWETRAPLLLRFNDQPSLGPPRLAHLTSAEYVRCKYVPQELFDAYFRFAVVRDPWSRSVSLYKHLNMNMPFRKFVLEWLPDQFKQQGLCGTGFFWFLRPQVDFLMDEKNFLVNDILRFERLNQDFERIARRSNLTSKLGHVNSSQSRATSERPKSFLKYWRHKLEKDKRENHANFADFYDEKTAEVIGRLYAEDVKLFDYQPPTIGKDRGEASEQY